MSAGFGKTRCVFGFVSLRPCVSLVLTSNGHHKARNKKEKSCCERFDRLSPSTQTNKQNHMKHKTIPRQSSYMNKPFTIVCSLLVACLGLFMALPTKAASLQKVTADWGTNGVPATDSMYIYVPNNVVSNPPILVVVHYCGGTACWRFWRGAGRWHCDGL